VSFLESVRAGGRTVVAISLRGRGGSDAPLEGWTPEHHWQDIEAVLGLEDIESAHLVGHSVGGAYALGYALNMPKRVASLTIGDHPPLVPPFDEDWEREVSEPGRYDVHPELAARIRRESRFANYTPSLDRLTVPLLVVHGSREGALLQSDDLELFARAPHCTMTSTDAGHDVFDSVDTARAWSVFVANLEASDETPT